MVDYATNIRSSYHWYRHAFRIPSLIMALIYFLVFSLLSYSQVVAKTDIDFETFRIIEYIDSDFYDLSEVKFINSEEEKAAHYTIINLTKLTDGFCEYLLDKDRIMAGEEDNIMLKSYEGHKFNKIMEMIKKNSNIYKSQFDLTKNIGNYWQMIYEIATTVPIKYMDNGPIIINSKKYVKINDHLESLNQSINKLDFTVDFDGIILKKPILLPVQDNLKMETNYDIFPIDEKFIFEDGTALKFRGYLYNQDSSIYPPQLRGIIIRIKNTAIGGIDQNFMDYMYGEKLFQNWTFGEIFIDEGLERAMNINRNAFNTADLHYQKLKQYLHELLHKIVFTNCRKRYDTRLEKKEKELKNKISELFKNHVYNNMNEKMEVNWLMETSDSPLIVNKKKNVINIYLEHPIYKDIRKKQHSLLQSILFLIWESYFRSDGSSEKLIELFLEELNAWNFKEVRG